MNITKYCKECDKQLPRTDFYKTYGNGLSTLCKHHSNQKRYQNMKKNPKPKKTLGFKKLGNDKCVEVLEEIKNGVKLIKIAEKYNIKYPTLLHWKRKGQLVE